jgi:hypothetical protein
VELIGFIAQLLHGIAEQDKINRARGSAPDKRAEVRPTSYSIREITKASILAPRVNHTQPRKRKPSGAAFVNVPRRLSTERGHINTGWAGRKASIQEDARVPI